jgi:hypothetical protein
MARRGVFDPTAISVRSEKAVSSQSFPRIAIVHSRHDPGFQTALR